MNLTIKNHYIPCFWTAFWNPDYLNSKRNGNNAIDSPREIKIFALNLKSNKIIEQKTKKVFFEKGAGIDNLTKEDLYAAHKRAYPEKYKVENNYFEKYPSGLTFDFESHFTSFEESYKTTLEKAIVNCKIENIIDKFSISMFVFFQTKMNHNSFNKMESLYKSKNLTKLEMFLHLKQTLSQPETLKEITDPFLKAEWSLYKTKKEIFPMSDNPVLFRPKHVFLPLAPDLLLEINLNNSVSPDNICTNYEHLPFFKYREFKKRTIENSSREIVFGKQNLLKNWQNSDTYKRHLKNNL
ncbi:MAG: DUF4238 domain-containing protein [Bacteroidota bacterium]|nr:DUF4238 domain-containing protein [Bacteroidota bacterium]